MRKYIIFIIVACIIVADRWTKCIIVKDIPAFEGIHLTPFFSIVYVKNYGGVFGFLSQFPGARFLFTFFPFVIIAVLLYMVYAFRHSMAKSIALSCILGGAIGNVYDRVIHGYVIDFLDFYYGSYHWPAFNVADISISVGVGLWLLVELLSLTGKRVKQKQVN